MTNCVGSALAGYALARLRYRGRRVATLVFILAMLVPVEGIIIAQFTTMRELGLNNTLIGVVLPGCIGAMNVLLMRNAFLNLPYEIEEAAFVDGANVWQRFLRIALPSVKGTIAVVAIFAFMGAWDDFLWPLIVLSDPSKFTLTIGLNYLHGTFANDERLVALKHGHRRGTADRPLRLPPAVLLPGRRRRRRQGLTSSRIQVRTTEPGFRCLLPCASASTTRPAKGGSTTGSTSTSTPYAPTSTRSPSWASTTSASSRSGRTSSPTGP